MINSQIFVYGYLNLFYNMTERNIHQRIPEIRNSCYFVMWSLRTTRCDHTLILGITKIDGEIIEIILCSHKYYILLHKIKSKHCVWARIGTIQSGNRK